MPSIFLLPTSISKWNQIQQVEALAALMRTAAWNPGSLSHARICILRIIRCD